MSLKRKAAHASIISVETPDSKRRKGSATDPSSGPVETPETTKEHALDFLSKLRASQDKQGKNISTHFETLPSRKEYPDYYELITLPISLGQIEDKARRKKYANMSAFEADLKRMVKNAKTYNDRTAEAFSDAEKIRKMMCNHMKLINPAYSDPSYVVEATPDTATADTPAPAETPTQASSRPKRSLTLNGPKTPSATPQDSSPGKAVAKAKAKAAASPPAASPPAEVSESTSNLNFEGKTFQQIQEDIIDDIMNLTNDDGDFIAANFLDKPPRALKDYYETIARPQSLRIIRKQVNGWVSLKEPPTGTSNYKTWAEFEEAVALIWLNARQYNEDESDIVQLANEVEAAFNERVTAAKRVIPEQTMPKIKLKMSAKSPDPPQPKVTLHVSKPAAGITVDTEALRRQQEHVKAGAAATSSSRPSSSALPEARPRSSASATPQAAAPAPAPSPHRPVSNEVKVESQTPVPAAASLVMHRPVVNGATPSTGIGAVTPAVPPPPSPPVMQPPQPTYNHAKALADSAQNRFRGPNRTAAESILGDVRLCSYPGITGLSNADRFDFLVTPSDKLTQQSFTFKVSPQHLWLQLRTAKKPSPEPSRSHFLYCFVDGKRLTPQVPDAVVLGGGGTGGSTSNSTGQPSETNWVVNLAPGHYTRIELQAVALAARGAPKTNPGLPDIEMERVIFFIQRQNDMSTGVY